MNKKVNYYEIVFNDESKTSICILGERKPTIEEANKFCKIDCEKFKATVEEVLDIDDSEAHCFFDMSEEATFPIFK